MKLARTFLPLMLLAIALGCSKKVAQAPPRPPVSPFVGNLQGVTVDGVTRPFIEQGYELVESRLRGLKVWDCRKKTDTGRVFIHLEGTVPNRITEIHAAFLRFGQADEKELAQVFFSEVARAAYSGKHAPELLAWLKVMTGDEAEATERYDPFDFRLTTSTGAYNLYIRPVPKPPVAKEQNP